VLQINPITGKLDLYGGTDSYGGAICRLYYSESTVEEDPGNGWFRFGEDPYIISSFYDADGNDVAMIWFFMLVPYETFLILRKRSKPSVFLLTAIGEIDEEEDYALIELWPVWGSEEEFFENGDEIMVSIIYAIAGADGDPGSPGLIWTGEWSAEAYYSPGHAVSSGGSSYICTAENTNQEPPNNLYWDVLAQGAE
jgi:hypothetical protein